MSITGNITPTKSVSGKISKLDLIQGKDAYETAVARGLFSGTAEEWYDSLKYTLTDADVAMIVEAVLEKLPKYDITYELVDCKVSGGTDAAYISPGFTFSTQLRNAGFDVFDGTIKVTMGDEDITEDVCTYDDTTYPRWYIEIPSVTAEVHIYCNWYTVIEEEEEEEEEETD